MGWRVVAHTALPPQVRTCVHAHYFGRLGLRRTADIFLLQLSGVFMQPAISGLSPSPSLWSLMYKACLLCLQNHVMANQLQVAGIDPGTLLDLLRDTSDGVQEANRVSGVAAGKGRGVGMLTQQLKALENGLTTIAIPYACNNPHCPTLSADTETAAVSGKGNLCGGCRVAHYCGEPCLRSHWRLHKPVCKALAAAAAAAWAAAAGAAP